MAKKKPRLTPELIDAICTRLKAGAFEQVAVESVGVQWSVYQDWLRRAEQAKGRAIYRLLCDAVRQARAQTRLRAEMEVREKDAKVWLLQGPGRATPGQEGWGSGGKAATAGAREAEARFFRLCAVLLQELVPFPEARVAVAALLGRLQDEQVAADREVV